MDYSKYLLVVADELVMNHTDLLTKWIDRSELNSVTRPVVRVFRLIHEHSDTAYFLRACQLGFTQNHI